MYRVITQEKAARPGLAVAGSVALLAVSILTALGVIALRRRVPETELGERLRLGDWPITLRCPVGWTPTGRMGATSGFVFLESPRLGGGRQLQLQRFAPSSFRPPSYLARPDTIGAILGLPESDMEGLYRDLGPVAFGDLPGHLMTVGPFAIHLGVAPDGTVYWVMMDSNGPATPADIKILRDVTASVELREPQTTDDPSTLWETLAFRFQAPRGGRLARGGDEDGGSIVCFGDPSAKGVWHVQGRLTFLAPGREPADLVRDYLADASRGLEPGQIEHGNQGGYAQARGRLSDAEERGLVQTVSVRALDDDLAVMLLGTADAAGGEKLREAEDIILGSLQRQGEAEDLSAAVARGRRLAARAVREAAEQWSDQDREWWYLILRRDKPVGFHRVLRTAGQRDGLAGFDFESAYHVEPSGQSSLQGRVISFLSRDGSSAVLQACGRRRTEGERSSWKMDEARREGSPSLDHEWGDDSGVEISRSAAVDANYLADPLDEWAYYLVAAEADPEETFLLSTSGHLRVHDVYWTKVTPLGPGAVREAPTRGRGLGVVVINDFDPEPEQWYFDPRGNLIEIQFGGGQGLVAASKREVYRHFRNAGRVLAEMEARWPQ